MTSHLSQMSKIQGRTGLNFSAYDYRFYYNFTVDMKSSLKLDSVLAAEGQTARARFGHHMVIRPNKLH